MRDQPQADALVTDIVESRKAAQSVIDSQDRLGQVHRAPSYAIVFPDVPEHLTRAAFEQVGGVSWIEGSAPLRMIVPHGLGPHEAVLVAMETELEKRGRKFIIRPA